MNMDDSKWILRLTIMSFIILLILLSFVLVGCIRRSREVKPPIIEHHIQDEIITTTPPALSVTPEPIKPWFWHSHQEYVPVVPADGAVITEHTFWQFDPNIESVTAYKCID